MRSGRSPARLRGPGARDTSPWLNRALVFLRQSSLIVAGVVVGCLVGAFAAMLTRAIYPMLLVPAAMGVAVGAVLGWLTYAFGVTHRAVIGVACLLGWASVLSAFHFVEYRVGFLDSVNLYAELDEPAGGGAGTNADAVLESLTGYTGFRGFLWLRIAAGARLRMFRGFGSSPWLAGSLWALDALLALAVIVMIVFRVRGRLVQANSEVVQT